MGRKVLKNLAISTLSLAGIALVGLAIYGFYGTKKGDCKSIPSEYLHGKVLEKKIIENDLYMRVGDIVGNSFTIQITERGKEDKLKDANWIMFPTQDKGCKRFLFRSYGEKLFGEIPEAYIIKFE